MCRKAQRGRQSRGSTGSLPSASTPKQHSCTGGAARRGRPLERLDGERELAHRERALRAEGAPAQALEVLRLGVLGAVDDPEVFAAAHFERGWAPAAPARDDDVGLTTMPSPPAAVRAPRCAAARPL